MITSAYYYSPVGRILASCEKGHLIKLVFDEEITGPETPGSLLLMETFRQLDEYFAGKRKTFSIPISPKGSIFQKKIWSTLLDIHYGEIKSYGDIADALGMSTGFRAVGSAINSNPINIVIPCHRVIGLEGDMIGYAGGIERKRFLLNLESHI